MPNRCHVAALTLAVALGAALPGTVVGALRQEERSLVYAGVTAPPAESQADLRPLLAPGVRVRIEGPRQRRATGRVLSVGDDALVVDLDSGETATCRAADGLNVQVRTDRHGNAGRGAMIGAMILGVGGLMVGGEFAANDYFDAGSEAIALGGLIGACAGGIVGALFGSLATTDEWSGSEAWPPVETPATLGAAGARFEGRVGVKLAF